MKISLEDFHEADNSYMGYCPDCDDFTREMTEPDAREYDCPICDNNNVMGAEWAVISGKIEIEE
jgi:hypothetical protein